MIQEEQNDLTLLVYDNPNPPKCLKFSKRTLKFFLFFLPLLITASLLITTYILANLKKIRLENKLKQPEIIKELNTEINKLKGDIEKQKLEVDSLVARIAKGKTDSNEDNISFFNFPLGYNNFTGREMALIEDLKHSVSGDKTKFDFRIVNNIKSGSKLSGYIFVLKFSGNSIEIYPNQNLNLEDYITNYNKGERFTASRFRPVNAKFRSKNSAEVSYRVIVFSKLGDLLLKKNFGPFKNE